MISVNTCLLFRFLSFKNPGYILALDVSGGQLKDLLYLYYNMPIWRLVMELYLAPLGYRYWFPVHD